MHQPDDICVVAYGCVLPDASDPAAFWKNLLNAHCAIREIPDQRWNKSLYYAPDSTDTDFTTGASAAWISNDVLNAGGFSGANRLRQLTMQAAAQIADKLTGVEPERVNIYLGCMDIDELYSRLIFPVRESDYIRANLPVSPNGLKETMASQLQRYFAADSASSDEFRDSMLTSSVLHHLKSHLKLKGEVGLIDAACASSLAAFDVSMQMLKAREADLAISGGIESNLGADAFILFSILGALAPDRCLPFDQRGKGLSLGEGAVLFALERLEDALKKGHQIHGVLKSCGASSDGRATSIFAPTVAGQKRAYAKAYAELDPAKIAYLECHGTGTRTGDETELQSVREFFDRPTLPLGSVKALVGHTKGAAGAVSLLKCLLSMQNRVIPPSSYYQEPLSQKLRANINTQPIPLKESIEPLLMGISSFGFGGINYHLVLQKYKPGNLANTSVAREPQKVVVNVDQIFSFAELQGFAHLDRLNLPPKSRAQIDLVQLGALSAVAELTARHKIAWSEIDAQLVNVILAGNLGLDACVSMSLRLGYAKLRDAFPELPEVLLKPLIALKERYPKITPDSSAGILNNVAAGRVANAYDFHGLNMSVDAGFNSLAFAMHATAINLQRQSGVTIIISIEENMRPDASGLERSGIRCLILSSHDLALKHALPISKTLGPCRYHHHVQSQPFYLAFKGKNL